MVDMEDYKTTLRMLPVCNCGYIFRDGIIIHEDINEKNGIKHATYSIEPQKCPNCGKEIEQIEHYGYTVEHRKD